ncbi:hypothetical protein CBR_g57960 [Chara braunii]|uniref:Uncharacterized protein n=1 Tax=Chara braunii TaxID=69332 RepID=A0A388MEQ6_CHABU|nr:hypothetical protein CBR_g57960 [Chara braunii]|eukprot:GBG92962.1 hypothetical protein CBR_g57960 [Chara braunii]
MVSKNLKFERSRNISKMLDGSAGSAFASFRLVCRRVIARNVSYISHNNHNESLLLFLVTTNSLRPPKCLPPLRDCCLPAEWNVPSFPQHLD